MIILTNIKTQEGKEAKEKNMIVTHIHHPMIAIQMNLLHHLLHIIEEVEGINHMIAIQMNLHLHHHLLHIIEE